MAKMKWQGACLPKPVKFLAWLKRLVLLGVMAIGLGMSLLYVHGFI